MITLRKSTERGHVNFGWLDSHHTFSFGSYYDPNHMGFRALRVINEDRVSPGAGFDTHGHRDMEILTYVLDGALEHQDNTGTGAVIYPGEVQRMSAGGGILHSEFNASSTDPVHFLQIWLLPNQRGLSPSYEQRRFNLSEKPSQLHLIAASEGEDSVVRVHQDVKLYAGILHKGDRICHRIHPNRHAWVQVARGSLSLNGLSLSLGDGAAISEQAEINIEVAQDAEILLFDLA